MFRDCLEDVAVGIAVPVGVLPGVVHRLHHRLGRAVVVLVARELRERVVVVERAPGPRRGAGGALRLREQVDLGPHPQITDGGGDAAHETPARNTHRSSVLVVNEYCILPDRRILTRMAGAPNRQNCCSQDRSRRRPRLQLRDRARQPHDVVHDVAGARRQDFAISASREVGACAPFLRHAPSAGPRADAARRR